MNTLNKFNTLATETLAIVRNAKASKDGSKSKQGELSFVVLQVLLNGKLQDIQHVRKAFSKEGPYHDLRMIMTRANAVALFITENGKVPVTTKEGTNEYDKTQVLTFASSEETPFLFNVSTAYNTIKADKTAPEVSKEEEAIAAYLAANGWETKAFKDQVKIQPDLLNTAILEGSILLEEKAKADKIINAPVMAKTIEDLFMELKGIDATLASELLTKLSPRQQSNVKQAKAA